MRRGLVLSIAALMTAASLGIAAPAHATDVPTPCPGAPTRPDPQSVYEDPSGIVHVDPTMVPDDATATAGWAVDWTIFWAFCLEAKLPTDGVWCQAGIALEIAQSMDPANLYLRYVYPEGNGFALNVPQLRSDVNRSAACHITA